MGSVGEDWEVFVSETGQWRPAKIINESGNNIELQYQGAPHSPDLEKTISTTRQAMNNKAAFRRK
jgi:hypothetical protein